MKYFEHIGTKIENIFNLLDSSVSSNLMSQLTVLFSISITIMIMLKAYAFLAGKSQEPVKDLIWDLALKMVIITFALNISGWLDLVTNAMDGLNEWAGGGTILYTRLDDLFEETRQLAVVAYDKGNIITRIFSGTLIYIGFLIGALPALIILISTSVTLKILIMIAPILIFCLFYGWLKNMFTQWLSLFFANTLTVLIMSLIFSSIMTEFENLLVFSKNEVAGGFDVTHIIFEVIVFGILLSVLVRVAVGIAEKLATVSMESVMQSGFGRALDPAKNYLEHLKWKRRMRGK
jgi:type IV secretion system protein VirB6